MAVILVIIAVASCLSVSVYADEVSTLDLFSAAKYSRLTISGTTATCKSGYDDAIVMPTITAVQTLEKHWAFGIFFAVDDDSSWTKTVNNAAVLSMTSTKSSLPSGTYRLRTDFTTISSSGQSETVPVYSAEKKFN